MISYELALKLKKAGFPQKYINISDSECKNHNHDLAHIGICCGVYEPSLSELIEACGEDFNSLRQNKVFKQWKKWVAFADSITPTIGPVSQPTALGMGGFDADTREEAVSLLWLELNKK